MTAVEPGDAPARRAWWIVGFAAVIFVGLFWQLGAHSFWDPDEAHYAETTRELLETGDWLAPYYNDQPFFDKPILFHLLQAVPMAIAGPSELGARLTPALAALALVGITGWLGAALAGARVGAVAALLLATNPGLIGLARYGILDTAFTAFLFGGAALVTVAALKDRPALQYPGYLCIAAAVLTKGPLALALSGLAFGLVIAVSPEARRRLLGLRYIAGLALVLGVAAPWFLYMWWRFGAAFVDGYVFNENISLFSRPLYANQPPWWFYLQILASGLLPWTALLMGRAYDDLRAARRGALDVVDILLWAWVAVIVGFFSVSQFKLDHYVFPAAPALTLLCARAWADLRDRPLAQAHRGARAGLWLIGPLLAVVGIVAGYVLVTRLDLPAATMVVPLAVTLAGAVFVVQLRTAGGRPPRAPVVVVAAMTIVYAGLLAFVVPALERQKVVPDLARWVAERAGAESGVCTYRLFRWNPAWRFYVGRHTELIDAPEDARRFFERPAPFYCAMLQPAHDELVAAGARLRIVYRRAGLWATSGRGLWRRRPSPTQFVVVTRAD